MHLTGLSHPKCLAKALTWLVASTIVVIPFSVTAYVFVFMVVFVSFVSTVHSVDVATLANLPAL